MQNQALSVGSAKPERLGLHRRVAASFNQGVERMGASRSGQPQFGRQWRLAPTAHTCRSTT